MILTVPKNTLTKHQRAAITKKGYTIIECDDPDKIRVINPEIMMNTSDWFMSALYALSVKSPISRQEYFINDLYNRLTKKTQPCTL